MLCHSVNLEYVKVWRLVGCTIFYVDEDRCEAIYVISPFLALAALTLDVDEDGAIEPLFTRIK